MSMIVSSSSVFYSGTTRVNRIIQNRAKYWILSYKTETEFFKWCNVNIIHPSIHYLTIHINQLFKLPWAVLKLLLTESLPIFLLSSPVLSSKFCFVLFLVVCHHSWTILTMKQQATFYAAISVFRTNISRTFQMKLKISSEVCSVLNQVQLPKARLFYFCSRITFGLWFDRA